MPWTNTPAARRASAATYNDPEYKANRKLAVRRAGGRCEQCGRRRKLQCDHIVSVKAGGTHNLANLQMLCSGPGSCHAKKTALEGGGYRNQPVTDPEPKPSSIVPQ